MLAGAAVICLSACRARGWGLARLWKPLLAVVFATAVVGSVLYLTGRTKEGDRASDEQRVMLMKIAPRMFADAPRGWDSWQRLGYYYSEWYREDSDRCLRFNMVSDHMTRITSAGWFRGGLYVFAWIAGLLFLLILALRGFSPLPAAAWTALAVAASFNVVMPSWWAWVVPAGSLVTLLKRKTGIGWRSAVLVPSGVGALAAVATVGGMLLAAEYLPSETRIRKDGPRVSVGGGNPVHWVVDDFQSLGISTAGKDLRRFLAENRRAPSIGYVRRLEDLPADPKKVRHLLLPGKRGEEFLDRFLKEGDGMALPEEIVFLSPMFTPSQIPERLLARARVRVVVGEFVARYDADFLGERPWVSVIPGAEVFIPGWPRFAVGAVR